jgi:hypothetical protein
MLVEPFPHGTCQRNPRPAILTMDNQSSRILLLAIYKQNNHLASAIIRSVMWAGTIGVCQTGHLQIERLHDAKVGTCQLSLDPVENLITSLIEN